MLVNEAESLHTYMYKLMLFLKKIVGVIVLASFELAWQRSTLDETPSG